METRIAKIISYLFHPLLMPSYGILLFFHLDKQVAHFVSFEVKRTLLLMTFCFTFVMPLLNTLILLRMKIITNLQLETKEERRMPLLITIIFYFAEYYILSEPEVPATLKLLMLSAIISLMLTLIINLFWKISAHMIGIGGITGMSIVLCYLFKNPELILISSLIFLAAIIAYARLKLAAHTSSEIYAGFLIGFLTPMIFLF